MREGGGVDGGIHVLLEGGVADVGTSVADPHPHDFDLLNRLPENILLLFKKSVYFKGTVQRDCSSVFFTYMDRPRPEYEPLLVLKFFRISGKFFNQKRFIFGPRPIHVCQQT